MLLQTVRPNIVQSIRAYRVDDLHAGRASMPDQHFLYANLTNGAVETRGSRRAIAKAFLSARSFRQEPRRAVRLHDRPRATSSGLAAGLRRRSRAAARQPASFDREAREQLLDVFRDAADFWAERKNPVQVLLFFSVARSPGIRVMGAGGGCGPSH